MHLLVNSSFVNSGSNKSGRKARDGKVSMTDVIRNQFLVFHDEYNIYFEMNNLCVLFTVNCLYV